MVTPGEAAVIVFLLYMLVPVAAYLLWVSIKALLKPLKGRRGKKTDGGAT